MVMNRYVFTSPTTGVVTGSQEDTTGCLPHTNEVASSRGTHDAILSNQELLHAISGTDLCDLGDDLGVVVTAIATNDEEGTLSTFGDRQEDASDEGFRVVGLLEDLDLLAKAGARGRLAGCSIAGPQATYVPGFWSVKGWMDTV